MKAVYVGSVRGYQPPVYRPGMGWTTVASDRRTGRGSAVFARGRLSSPGMFTVARRRTGFKMRVAIVAVSVTIIAMLLLLFSGSIQL